MEKAEAEYSLLPSAEKGHHKAQLTKMRKQYESSRKDFFNYDNAIASEKPIINEEEKDERDSLLGGIDELYRQEEEIDNIIHMGHEADGLQTNAGRNLRNQRDVISKSAKSTSAAQNNLTKANRKIELISMRNMIYIGSLYGMAGVLFLIIICIFILKIKNI